MISATRLELSRIFSPWGQIIFSLLVASSLFFSYLYLSDFNNRLQYREHALGNASGTIEEEPAKLRVLFRPSPLTVFFNPSGAAHNPEAYIDGSGAVRFHTNPTGLNRFRRGKDFGRLVDIVSVPGSLIMALLGFFAPPDRRSREFFSKTYPLRIVLCRLILLDLLIVLLFWVNYRLAGLMNIRFSLTESQGFVLCGAAAVLLGNFFYAGGLLARAFSRNKKKMLYALLAAWFLLAVALPGLFGTLRSTLPGSSAINETPVPPYAAPRREILQAQKTAARHRLLSPVEFFRGLAEETSGAGLPGWGALPGGGVMLVCPVIFFLLWLWRNRGTPTGTKPPGFPPLSKPGKVLYVFTSGDKREKYLQSLEPDEWVRLNPGTMELFPGEVRAGTYIRHVCRENKLDKGEVLSDLGLFKPDNSFMKRRLGNCTVEEKQKLLCVLAFADKRNAAFNDFAQGVPEAFERTFLRLLSRESLAGKRMMYISSRMYTPLLSMERRLSEKSEYRIFAVNPLSVSMK